MLYKPDQPCKIKVYIHLYINIKGSLLNTFVIKHSKIHISIQSKYKLDLQFYVYVVEVFIFPFASLSFVHCIVCPSSNYGFWLPLWYLQTRKCCGVRLVFFFCIVCTSSTYSLELHFWYQIQFFLDIDKMFQKGHFKFKILNNHNILCQLLKIEETTGIVIDIIVCLLDLHLPMPSLTIIHKVEKVKFLQMVKCSYIRKVGSFLTVLNQWTQLYTEILLNCL